MTPDERALHAAHFVLLDEAAKWESKAAECQNARAKADCERFAQDYKRAARLCRKGSERAWYAAMSQAERQSRIEAYHEAWGRPFMYGIWP